MPGSYVSDGSSCSSVSASNENLYAGNNFAGSKTTSKSVANKATIAALQQREKALSLDEICRQTRFSRKQIRAFYRTLKQECPRGIISEDILSDVYTRLFPEGNGTLYVKNVFRVLDTHGSGGITFTQLLVFLSTITKGSYLERLKWVFRLYDIDGDGAIAPGELFTVIWSIRELAGINDRHGARSKAEEETKRRVESIFTRWDVNKDGLVTLDEFLAYSLRDEHLESSFNYFDCEL